jgi:hypothetical protein
MHLDVPCALQCSQPGVHPGQDVEVASPCQALVLSHNCAAKGHTRLCLTYVLSMVRHSEVLLMLKVSAIVQSERNPAAAL